MRVELAQGSVQWWPLELMVLKLHYLFSKHA